ncbi:hypothetical protein SLEP1_g46343 [Rubroshorea leprosula]|uniref:C2 DOCK-type domain-containing protein n=1 Tax=Rubroshorea leprosula TaxID=152421 RepID=A0AAV5LLX5_9ROSI|nr:hypothetical protein SLEP1_g46343 [Rubroshorea leprosula]
MEVASISTDEGTLSASQNHLNFTSLGFLFYYDPNSCVPSAANPSIPILFSLNLCEVLGLDLESLKILLKWGVFLGAMFCGFLVFWCKRVLAVEEVVNARYGVIEQWALLLRNAWPKVSTFPLFVSEPFYGTICLYNRERREKLSEDFYFSILPTEMQDTNKVSSEPHGLFYLDAPSAFVCLLIQLEKPATEVTPSVYSRKEPFQAFDFQTTLRNEPFLQLFHSVYVYPLTVSLSWKRNLFVRVELRKDDADVRRQPLEAMYPREPGLSLQKWAHMQVAVGAGVACQHDEIKVSLPAVWTPLHHLIFTFFHVDLQ